MFKKADNGKGGNPLADRMKAISAKPALDDAAYSDVFQSNKVERTDRKPTFKQGTAVLAHGERVPIVVKNVSPTGAKLEFFKQVVLTDRVLLIEPTLQIKRYAEVVWQTDGAAGVRFEKP